LAFEAPLLVIGADDRPRGYLVPPWGPLATFGNEVAADDWPAILALLQHHAHRLGTLPDPPAEVRWPLPPASPTCFLLADHLPIRSESSSRPRAGWMARAVDPAALLAALLPAWHERWSRGADWSGVIALTIDERTWSLTLGPAGAQLVAGPAAPDAVIRLSGRVFTQLVFGFRSAEWAAMQPDKGVPPELDALLGALFPPVQPWIAPTNGC
jgi:hypothetical protein